MGDEEMAEYALALRELKVNSKPVITSLTMLAGEIAGGDAAAAATVAGLVERHIRAAAPKTKLTGFYLLDSIVKNVKGHFVQCFARNLPDLFLSAFATQDEATKKSMVRLLGTWTNVFPQTTLGAIKRGLPPGASQSSSSSGAFLGGALPPPPGAAGGVQLNAAAAGSLLASMVQGGGDVSALLKSIAAAKAAQRAGSPAEAAAAPLPPPPAPPRAPPPPATLAAAEPRTPSIHEPPALTADFDPSDEGELRRRRERVVDALYGDQPHQCATTGVRFKTRAELDKHLDAQVVRRRAKREGTSGSSRGWFVDSGSWIRGAAAEAAEAAGPSFVDAVAAEREAREVLENCSAPVDETQKTCALSGEPFETFWNAEEEEWHYRGAVVLKKTIGSVPAGALALATAVPRASENDIAAAGDEDEDEDATPSPKKAASPAKRKRAPAVKSEPVAAIKAEPLEDEGAQPAKRRSARRG
jgi:pre-mRNA cleavage complex 2 protein Pcf11